ncbi:hypothetical protein [Sciscionella marina]|uniref:hypothetical protein n=1 Tax=Sciscionella marina TaxID=508770 RepID=UPI0003702A08|nr:hypothetical protein [Sciscionella marina]
MDEYAIDLLRVGAGEVPGPEIFWMSAFDSWYPLVFQSVLVRGNGVTALVNTGPARDIGPMNEKWATVLGQRARMVRADGEFIADRLFENGVEPEEITHVILTPLQLYSVSNIPLFPNAEICLARRGWVHFHTTHEHPHDDRSTSIPDDVLVHLVTEAWPRVRLLEDETELAPGLRTWWCGGHHRASMVVEADSTKGTVAISDSYFYLENVARDHPIGISENIYEATAAYRRVRETADVIVPLYDPKNFDRFAGGKVA